MSQFTDYAENKIVDLITGAAAFAAPVGIYLSLHTGAIGENSSANEVSGNGYARQQVSFTAPTSRRVESTAQIDFLPSGGGFGTVTYVGFWDAATGGNLIAYDEITDTNGDPAPIVTEDGTIFSFDAGNFAFEISSSNVSDYLADALLNHVFRATSFTSPATLRYGLYENTPGADNSGTELSGTGYSRQAASFGSSSDGQAVSTGAIQFPAITDGSDPVSAHFGMLDAASGGNLLFFGSMGK
ncbi:MAG: hypothetical protein AAFO69_04905, partial [Bacteroidota bacterium]